MATADAPFSRVLSLRRSVEPKPFDLRADRAECEAVRALLDVPALADLRVAGEIDTVDDRWRLRGAVEAAVVQTCVVTFAPVASDVVAAFDRWLVIGDDGGAESDEIDPEEADVDRLVGPEVDVGAVAVEELALSLEPYPRSPDADAALAAVRDERPDDGPFAALARRRGRS